MTDQEPPADVPRAPSITPADDDGVYIAKPELTIQIEGIAGKLLDQKITAALNKVLLYVITAMVAALAGGMLGMSHELNAKVSETLGRETAEEKLYEDGQHQLRLYQCLNDPKAKDKAECYR